jgi:hypothetical protein
MFVEACMKKSQDVSWQGFLRQQNQRSVEEVGNPLEKGVFHNIGKDGNVDIFTNATVKDEKEFKPQTASGFSAESAEEDDPFTTISDQEWEEYERESNDAWGIIPGSKCDLGECKEHGGTKYDDNKPLVALVPGVALTEEAKVWTFGAKKYTMHNWKKGITYTRILSAILRHTIALLSKEDLDKESGIHHAAHIRANAAMLIEFYIQGRTDLDDRG